MFPEKRFVFFGYLFPPDGVCSEVNKGPGCFVGAIRSRGEKISNGLFRTLNTCIYDPSKYDPHERLEITLGVRKFLRRK
jgi:hypothetical protein